MRASLRAALAAAAVTAAVATGCDSGAKDTDASIASTTPSSPTTTIRMGGKYADIQTGVLTSKTTYVWEMEIGGGVTLRCVQEYNGDDALTYEHCKKIRPR